jgi:mono/diheme cytochrome c family protein
MKKTRLFTLVVLLITAISIPVQSFGHEHSHWQAPPKEAARKNPIPADKDSVDRGALLYQTHCAMCHGEQGLGDGPAGATLDPRPTDLSHAAAHHKDGDIAWKIAIGKGAMPGSKGVLTEAQVWDLVNFIKTFDSHAKHHEHKEHHH